MHFPPRRRMGAVPSRKCRRRGHRARAGARFAEEPSHDVSPTAASPAREGDGDTADHRSGTGTAQHGHGEFGASHTRSPSANACPPPSRVTRGSADRPFHRARTALSRAGETGPLRTRRQPNPLGSAHHPRQRIDRPAYLPHLPSPATARIDRTSPATNPRPPHWRAGTKPGATFGRQRGGEARARGKPSRRTPLFELRRRATLSSSPCHPCSSSPCDAASVALPSLFELRRPARPPSVALPSLFELPPVREAAFVALPGNLNRRLPSFPETKWSTAP